MRIQPTRQFRSMLRNIMAAYMLWSDEISTYDIVSAMDDALFEVGISFSSGNRYRVYFNNDTIPKVC